MAAPAAAPAALRASKLSERSESAADLHAKDVAVSVRAGMKRRGRGQGQG